MNHRDLVIIMKTQRTAVARRKMKRSKGTNAVIIIFDQYEDIIVTKSKMDQTVTKSPGPAKTTSLMKSVPVTMGTSRLNPKRNDPRQIPSK